MPLGQLELNWGPPTASLRQQARAGGGGGGILLLLMLNALETQNSGVALNQKTENSCIALT
jgi:hypothetical protein